MAFYVDDVTANDVSLLASGLLRIDLNRETFVVLCDSTPSVDTVSCGVRFTVRDLKCKEFTYTTQTYL